MKREIKFTQIGRIVTLYLAQLLRDKDVDINKALLLCISSNICDLK